MNHKSGECNYDGDTLDCPNVEIKTKREELEIERKKNNKAAPAGVSDVFPSDLPLSQVFDLSNAFTFDLAFIATRDIQAHEEHFYEKLFVHGRAWEREWRRYI